MIINVMKHQYTTTFKMDTNVRMRKSILTESVQVVGYFLPSVETTNNLFDSRRRVPRTLLSAHKIHFTSFVRDAGIEPASQPWEGRIMPLN